MDLRGGSSPSVRLANCPMDELCGEECNSFNEPRPSCLSFGGDGAANVRHDLVRRRVREVCRTRNQSRPVLRSPSSRTMSALPSATATSTERPSDDHETRRAMNVGRPPKSVI